MRKPKKVKAKHGGLRTGSGRPIEGDEPKKKRTITISPADELRADEIGQGNVSKGISLAIQQYQIK